MNNARITPALLLLTTLVLVSIFVVLFLFRPISIIDEDDMHTFGGTSEDFIYRLVDDADNSFGRRNYEMAETIYDRALDTLESIVDFEEGRSSPDTQLLDRLRTKAVTISTKRQIALFGVKVDNLRNSLVANAP